MSSTSDKLQALIVPMRQQNLVLPQSALVEVLPMPELSPAGVSETWLAGLLEWRSQEIPLVSIERYCGWAGLDQVRARRVAVLRSIAGIPGLEYYAIEVQGIPHPIRLGEADVVPVEGERRCDLIESHVQASGIWSVLMKMDVLEQSIDSVLA
ncbi:MAG: chemotaxis protein CheW [bacterium]